MKGLVIRWLVSALALYLTSMIVRGIVIDGVAALLFAAITIGVLNAVVRPILELLALPITCLTLGLFHFVINAIVFAIAAALVPGVVVNGFVAALIGALIVSAVGLLMSVLVRERA